MVTNTNDISLLLAVWLVDDRYDYEAGKQFKDKPYLSATTLMRPVKQIVLAQRIPYEERQEEDVEDFIARSLGHTIHDGVERAWKDNYAINLRKLGYPQDVIDLVRVNPTDEEVKANPDIIAVYLEQRMYREIDGFVLGGKYDAIAEGIIQDVKSTSAWAYVFGTRDDEHRLQLDIYNWMDKGQPLPKITEGFGKINYVFTDWQKAEAARKPDVYPARRTLHKDLILKGADWTEKWIKEKLAAVKKAFNKPESELPRCTDEELWRTEPQFKYYKDPAKANTPGARSTKNFDNLADANRHLSEMGGVGVVKTIPGTPKRCAYCPAFDICNQRKEYFADDGTPV